MDDASPPGCSVTAVDLSGYGDSGRRPVYTFDHWAEEIAAVACATPSAQPPVVVAHSPGGIATFRSAARRWREAFGPLCLYQTREDALAHFRTVPEQPELLPYVVDHVAAHSVRQVEGGWTWKFDPTFFDHLVDIGAETLGAILCRVAVLRVMLDQPLALIIAARASRADWRHSHAIQVPLDPRR